MTVIVVAASVVLIAVVGVTAWIVLHGRSASTEAASAPASSMQPTPGPAQVSVPADPYGQVHVRTASGQTVCAVTAGDVQCNVHFANQQGPARNGVPATGVAIDSRGAFQWLYGDPGDPTYVTMDDGTVYHALGWLITPTSQGTTFTCDATGHGMTLSGNGFTAF